MEIIGKEKEVLAKGAAVLKTYFPFVGKIGIIYAEKCSDMRGYSVGKYADGFRVRYGQKNFFFAALADVYRRRERKSRPRFERMGVMLDCARNGVPSAESLKRFAASLALAGYTYLGLYLEDCLEVENEPLFGYMRGRYTREELREVVGFAAEIGIEVVPYVQTLAHLRCIFNHWQEYFATVRDTNDILLADEPRTYMLIDNILASVAENFPCRRVNLGMDEAFMLGLGKYREKNGYVDRFAVFSKHLTRVLKICEKYRLQPQIWPDMYLALGKGKNVKAPEELSLDVCSYFKKTEEEYKKNIADVRKFTEKIHFASAVHKWYGYAPLNEYTCFTALPAVCAAVGETEDFCVTAWGDDGAECSYNAVWYALLRIADEADEFPAGEEALSWRAMLITGYSMGELLAMDLPNKVFDCPMEKAVNVSKYLLFEDAFMGIADRADSMVYAQYFTNNGRILRKLSRRKSPYAGIFRMLADLCAVLELKSTLRPLLLDAYQNKNKAKLSELAEKIYPQILRRVQTFYESFRTQWCRDNKSFGFEVQDVRIGGLLHRLRHQRRIIMDYVVGKQNNIPELEERNLSPSPKKDLYNGAECYVNYEMNVTYSVLAYRTYN